MIKMSLQVLTREIAKSLHFNELWNDRQWAEPRLGNYETLRFIHFEYGWIWNILSIKRMFLKKERLLYEDFQSNLNHNFYHFLRNNNKIETDRNFKANFSAGADLEKGNPQKGSYVQQPIPSASMVPQLWNPRHMLGFEEFKVKRNNNRESWTRISQSWDQVIRSGLDQDQNNLRSVDPWIMLYLNVLTTNKRNVCKVVKPCF